MSESSSFRLSDQEIKKLYAKFASSYDWFTPLTESKAHNKALEMAEISDGMAVLEVAVGTGKFFSWILEKNPSGRNAGIDLTPEMLDRAQNRLEKKGYTNFTLHQGRAQDLNFEDESFHVLINNYMLDLLPEEDYLPILEEFKRVLKPGGRLVLTNMAPPEKWYEKFWEWLYKKNPRLMGGCHGIDILPYVKKAGFEKVDQARFSQLTFPSRVVWADKGSTS